MVRVLKTNGRLLVIDFGGSKRERHSLIGHLRAHRNFDVFDLVPTFLECGLTGLKTGSLGFSDLTFLIASRPGDTPLRFRLMVRSHRLSCVSLAPIGAGMT